MLKIKLPKNRMDYLIAEAERRIKLPVLERGWEYFHRGFVDQVNLVHGYVLQAEVRGKDNVFRPSLDLEAFERSSCTCSFEGYCKHRAALLFYAYSAHGRPELLLMQLTQAIKIRRRNAKAAAKNEKPSEAAAAILLPELPPKEWSRLFEQRFHGYSLSNQHSVEQFQQAVWDSLGEAAADWSPSIRGLFHLHVTLYILQKIDQFHQNNQSSYLSYYIENGCKLVAAACWDKLKELVVPGAPIRLAASEHPQHWSDTIELAGTFVVKHRLGPVQWLDVYRFLWGELFYREGGADSLPRAGNKAKAAEGAAATATATAKERRRLSLLLEQNGTPRQKDGVLLASAYFDLLEGEDQRAMSRLDELQTKALSDYYVLLDHFTRHEEWERLLVWLRWLLPVLGKAKQEEFNIGCSYWVEAMKHQPTDEEWIRVMLSLLPRSYYYYTDYLMKTERYRQWVDLQLAAGVTPANLYTAELRTVESHDPTLLLPLFHQSVEKAVMEKNRDSYKLAIRHLKKLHSIYKQLDRTGAWNDYIDRLHIKFARLRAFREELAKGQWTL